MFGPLSIFTYYFNNKRKVLPIIAIIGVSILAVTSIVSLTDSIVRDSRIETSFYDYYQRIVIPGSLSNFDEVKEDIEFELSNSSDIDYFLEGTYMFTRVESIVSPEGRAVIFLKDQDYQQFLDETSLVLIAGELPSINSNQIILHESTLKNKGLEIGDMLGNDVDKKESIPGEFIIVGVFSGNEKSIAGLGNFNYLLEQDTKFSTNFFIHSKPEKYSNVDSLVRGFEGKNTDLYSETKTTITESKNADLSAIDGVVGAIVTISTLTVTISIALLNIIFFMQRSEEFGLLSAVGYSKKFIIYKTIIETLGIIFTGWIIGIVLSEIIYTIININLLDPKSIQPLTIIDIKPIIYSLTVPITVAIFSSGTVFWTLLRMDPITIIEKK